jgi:hypothetical protein
MMGQAAGIAAAMSIQKKCPVRGLDPRDVIKSIVKRGASLSV